MKRRQQFELPYNGKRSEAKRPRTEGTGDRTPPLNVLEAEERRLEEENQRDKPGSGSGPRLEESSDEGGIKEESSPDEGEIKEESSPDKSRVGYSRDRSGLSIKKPEVPNETVKNYQQRLKDFDSYYKDILKFMQNVNKKDNREAYENSQLYKKYRAYERNVWSICERIKKDVILSPDALESLSTREGELSAAKIGYGLTLSTGQPGLVDKLLTAVEQVKAVQDGYKEVLEEVFLPEEKKAAHHRLRLQEVISEYEGHFEKVGEVNEDDSRATDKNSQLYKKCRAYEKNVLFISHRIEEDGLLSLAEAKSLNTLRVELGITKIDYQMTLREDGQPGLVGKLTEMIGLVRAIREKCSRIVGLPAGDRMEVEPPTAGPSRSSKDRELPADDRMEVEPLQGGEPPTAGLSRSSKDKEPDLPGERQLEQPQSASGPHLEQGPLEETHVKTSEMPIHEGAHESTLPLEASSEQQVERPSKQPLIDWPNEIQWVIAKAEPSKQHQEALIGGSATGLESLKNDVNALATWAKAWFDGLTKAKSKEFKPQWDKLYSAWNKAKKVYREEYESKPGTKSDFYGIIKMMVIQEKTAKLIKFALKRVEEKSNWHGLVEGIVERMEKLGGRQQRLECYPQWLKKICEGKREQLKTKLEEVRGVISSGGKANIVSLLHDKFFRPYRRDIETIGDGIEKDALLSPEISKALKKEISETLKKYKNEYSVAVDAYNRTPDKGDSQSEKLRWLSIMIEKVEAIHDVYSKLVESRAGEPMDVEPSAASAELDRPRAHTQRPEGDQSEQDPRLALALEKSKEINERIREMNAEKAKEVSKDLEALYANMDTLSKNKEDAIVKADKNRLLKLYKAMCNGTQLFFTAIYDLRTCDPSPEELEKWTNKGTRFIEDVKDIGQAIVGEGEISSALSTIADIRHSLYQASMTIHDTIKEADKSENPIGLMRLYNGMRKEVEQFSSDISVLVSKDVPSEIKGHYISMGRREGKIFSEYVDFLKRQRSRFVKKAIEQDALERHEFALRRHAVLESERRRRWHEEELAWEREIRELGRDMEEFNQTEEGELVRPVGSLAGERMEVDSSQGGGPSVADSSRKSKEPARSEAHSQIRTESDLDIKRAKRWEKLERAVPAIKKAIDEIKTKLDKFEKLANDLRDGDKSYKDDHIKLEGFLMRKRQYPEKYDFLDVEDAYMNCNDGFSKLKDYQGLYESWFPEVLGKTEKVLYDNVTDNLSRIASRQPTRDERARIRDLRQTTMARLTDDLTQLRNRFEACLAIYDKKASGTLYSFLTFSDEDQQEINQWLLKFISE